MSQLKGLQLLLIILLATAHPAGAQKKLDVKYLEFAERSANWTYDNLDSLTGIWRANTDPNSVFGYRPPSRMLEIATIYAHLYKMKRKKVYAQRAKEILLKYDSFRDVFPDWAAEKRPDYTNGVPALPDFFTAQRFLRPYEILKESSWFSEEETRHLEEVMAHSVNYLLQSQEWGAMNRAALRAETMALALKVMPEHCDIEIWKMYEKALIFDNWGNWEIEDASHYNAIWLYALIGYGYATDQMSKLFYEPEMFYYSRYFLELFCPDYMIPDFGDAYWQSNWSRWLVYFETAAGVYQSSEHKWVAEKLAEKYINWDNTKSIGLAYILLDCYLLGDQSVEAVQPKSGSVEVMDDVIGKKVVMRSGWNPDDSYLLLNYKDEGEAGYLSRGFLRDGIVVEEEKMTHGHADENSIVLLMNNRGILLHDGGYRDFMPSGPFGAYRQDYFHNRMCVRPEKIFFGQKEGEFRYSPTDRPEIPGQSVLGFLRNSGGYKNVRTQKIDFLTFNDFDYSRTRVIDDNMAYESDRIIVWLKEANCYVVVDLLKGTRENFLTAANLWYTRKIYEQGEHWYDTGYDSLRNLSVDSDQRLLIHFPRSHYRFESVEKAPRYWQEEYLISEYSGQFFELGQTIAFVTVLYPHDSKIRPESLLAQIELVQDEEESNGICLRINQDEVFYEIGVKADLRKEMIRDYRRPKYTYESGKVSYGEMKTNADFYYLKGSNNALKYTLVNVSKAIYKGKELFSQKPNYFGLAFDGSGDVSGISKARYWRSVEEE
ncbi:MAG: hypothetical protein HN352_05170 [Bacteroidetes bacterium]|nr:hypothetical protein [Bacteroidota bacterium]MBT3750956.1 hypothetical protein [Bacteroidota bacterium]MBT4400306.1 hypothetical protein [Bacteroidota bacterium]MBT4410522.1 hypothetical protein [Bacteroidota bacterium]MBT7092496.1 hypothetical protein [Bacteroidota bacterium]